MMRREAYVCSGRESDRPLELSKLELVEHRPPIFLFLSVLVHSLVRVIFAADVLEVEEMLGFALAGNDEFAVWPRRDVHVFLLEARELKRRDHRPFGAEGLVHVHARFHYAFFDQRLGARLSGINVVFAISGGKRGLYESHYLLLRVQRRVSMLG